MFSSTFHVISGKFGLLFSQCTWRGDVEQLLHLPSSKNKCWKEGVFYCKITIKIQKKLFTFKFAKVGSVVWSIRSLWPLAPTQPEYSRNWASRNVFFLYISQNWASRSVFFRYISQNWASRSVFLLYFVKLCFQERIFPLYITKLGFQERFFVLFCKTVLPGTYFSVIYHKTKLPGTLFCYI